ncbi:ASS1 [Cordylochernes scorpioides]|uniref:argininosuccinate synthase n=1 Tax=Cordylochernes scorpioides TaxID=51811 RepID=A0ABY6KIA0_9ARAC|nr:ASS1 [Cordylochernes scorpioides]
MAELRASVMTAAGKETVVLAYSGGLDTTCILAWLRDSGHDVVAFCADLGQGDDMDEVRANAEKIGAKHVVIRDLRREFVQEFVWPAVAAGAIYEDRYLLGTALARPLIARELLATAREHGATSVSHGATGKGNDQIRFELACLALQPGIKEHNFHVPATPKAPWSIDSNLMHTSYESGVLEDPAHAPPPELFQRTRHAHAAPDTPLEMEVDFSQGVPVRVSCQGRAITDPLEMVEFLNQAAGEHGVGRVDVVENRVVGMKSRGVYETPGVTILYHAHLDLECMVLDREVRRLKQYLATRFSEQVYGGLWFSPECEFTRKCLTESQRLVTGSVRLRLSKGNVEILGRSSPSSPYNQDLVSMDVQGDYTPEDAEGFIRITAVRLAEHMRVKAAAGVDG